MGSNASQHHRPQLFRRLAKHSLIENHKEQYSEKSRLFISTFRSSIILISGFASRAPRLVLIKDDIHDRHFC